MSLRPSTPPEKLRALQVGKTRVTQVFDTQVQGGTYVLSSTARYLTTIGTRDPDCIVYAVHLDRAGVAELHEALNRALEEFT